MTKTSMHYTPAFAGTQLLHNQFHAPECFYMSQLFLFSKLTEHNGLEKCILDTLQIIHSTANCSIKKAGNSWCLGVIKKDKKIDLL